MPGEPGIVVDSEFIRVCEINVIMGYGSHFVHNLVFRLKKVERYHDDLNVDTRWFHQTWQWKLPSKWRF